ncbi:NIPSNAP family protein [Roseiterribacter gracilis]|uniref:NIPSNAP family containing protein n=1 Tax=Roseiterribacter gracilis TaxID=2812848 RepID=A0A8S8XHB0_9PROT|nr:NIPSNAP family containing protein [Rhodospirillales bacterium TMPK1]
MTSYPFVEYRRYTLHLGRRDELITLFEREFVETQEAEGMTLLGQFRVLDRPELFVWLRGFPDMATRGDRLGAFYGGPAWKSNRDAANATMIDSDDVFLLRPAAPQFGFTHDVRGRAPIGSETVPAGLFLAVTWFVADTVAFVTSFERSIAPALRAAGGQLRATYVRAHEENNFPALPVREENVFVCFVAFDPGASRPAIEAVLAPHCDARTELLWLTPTERSALHLNGE